MGDGGRADRRTAPWNFRAGSDEEKSHAVYSVSHRTAEIRSADDCLRCEQREQPALPRGVFTQRQREPP